MLEVSTFQTTTKPSFRVESAPTDSQYLHYSVLNVEFERIIHGVADCRWQKKIDAVKKRGYDNAKTSLPCFTPSGTFRIRCDWDLLQYSQLVHLDYDKVENAGVVRDRLAKSPYCYAAFLSPSGIGVKVFVRVNSSADAHGHAFNQVREVFDSLAGLKSDGSVRNLSRLCYISADPTLFYNPNATVFEVSEVRARVTIPDLGVLAVDDKTAFSWLYNLTMKGKYQGEVLHDYSPGRRNNFIFVFACNCNRYGIDKERAFDYARQIWVSDSDGLTATEFTHAINSAYRYKNEFGTFRLPKNITV